MKKIIGILVMTLLIVTTIIPVGGSVNVEKNQVMEKLGDSNDFPKSSLSRTLPPFILALVNGDWDYWSDSPNMFTIPTGNVGIGTDTPNAKLEVKGDIRLTSDSTNLEDPQLCISPTKISACPQMFESQSLTISSYGGGSLILNDYFGYVGIGTTIPTSKVDISGTEGCNQLRLRTSCTPSNTNDPSGDVGDFAWDNDYLYIKTNAGWKRAALESWP